MRKTVTITVSENVVTVSIDVARMLSSRFSASDPIAVGEFVADQPSGKPGDPDRNEAERRDQRDPDPKPPRQSPHRTP